MQIASVRDRDDLRELALANCSHTRRSCFTKAIFICDIMELIAPIATGRAAWYLLGHAKCLRLSDMKGPWAAVAEHLAERAAWALKPQRENGLWDNFFGEQGPPPDTSGSAGIAAALVRAHDLGLIGESDGQYTITLASGGSGMDRIAIQRMDAAGV